MYVFVECWFLSPAYSDASEPTYVQTVDGVTHISPSHTVLYYDAVIQEEKILFKIHSVQFSPLACCYHK